MTRAALALAFAATVAAGLPAPGLYVAIGLGIAAIGTGRIGYARPEAPGTARLACAAAITVGAIGALLGLVRVAMTLAAIDRIDRLIG